MASHDGVESRLRVLLITIGNDMTTSDRNTVKFKAEIPHGRSERIQDNVSLWDYFDEHGDIDYRSEEVTLSFLRQILDPSLFGGDYRLLNHVIRYGGGEISARPDTPQLDSSLAKAFEYLHVKLNADWRRFFRALFQDCSAGHSFTEAMDLEYKHERHSEKVYSGLMDWHRQFPNKTVDDVLEALQKAELNWHREEIILRLQGDQPLSVT